MEKVIAGTPRSDTEYLFSNLEADHKIMRSPVYKMFAANVFRNEGYKIKRKADTDEDVAAVDYFISQEGLNGQEVVGIDPKINRSFYENLGINPSDKGSLVPFSDAEQLIYGSYWSQGSEDRYSLRRMDEMGGILPEIILALGDQRYHRGTAGDGLLLKTMWEYDRTVNRQKLFPYMNSEELAGIQNNLYPDGAIGPKAAKSLSERSAEEQLEIFSLYRSKQAKYGKYLDANSEYSDSGYENRYSATLFDPDQMEELGVRRDIYSGIQAMDSMVYDDETGDAWRVR